MRLLRWLLIPLALVESGCAHQMQSVPGPDGGPLGIENVKAFGKDPLTFLTGVRDRYGDLSRFQFGDAEVYLIAHPDLVREILVNQRDRLVKWERIKPAFEHVATNDLVILDGEPWREARSLSMPAFEAERMQGYVAMIADHTTRAVSQWGDGSVEEMDGAMTRLVTSIFGRAMFNIDDIEHDTPELAQALESLLQLFMQDATSAVHAPDWVPTSQNVQREKDKEVLHKAIGQMIAERRQANHDEGDALAALLGSVDAPTGHKFSDDDAYQYMLGLWVAGRETPVRAVTWATYLLARNPTIQEKLYEEVSGLMPDGKLDASRLMRMQYLQQVVKETLRLYPPAWSLVFRKAVQPLQLRGQTIPAGSVVYVSTYVLHHDKRFFPDPEAFEPDRFSAGWDKRIPEFAYFPFSSGPRSCLGQHLAETEITAILATLVDRFRFELAEPGEEIKADAKLTLHPHGDVRIRMRTR